MLSDSRLEAIDNAIANLQDDRLEIEAEIQAACSHEWCHDILFRGARHCEKCGLQDYADACTVVDIPDEMRERWPHHVPPSRYCFKHKRALKECEIALR